MWESHLRSSLMSGLKPEIVTMIKQTCIGWEDEKLEKIRQHALHAEKLLEEKGGRKREKELQLTSLTMYKDAPGRGMNYRGRGRGRGRGRRQRFPQIDPDACYFCGNKLADTMAKNAAIKAEPPLTCVTIDHDSSTLPSDSLTAMQAFATTEEKKQWISQQVKDALPKPAEGVLHDIRPGDFVVTKDLRRKHWKSKRWNGPFQVLLITQTAVKVAERATWIHASHCRKIPAPPEGDADQ
ncbi:hypothetical protein QQF64_029844 [Cirrhinus molitorella]|uniref:Murine leukemia virus integrase C-terminal domain-containing protein n=1 Tax=Cirrhinus molitorella TaxID=172907 RepID=A0ABR3N1N4_9TELE